LLCLFSFIVHLERSPISNPEPQFNHPYRAVFHAPTLRRFLDLCFSSVSPQSSVDALHAAWALYPVVEMLDPNRLVAHFSRPFCARWARYTCLVIHSQSAYGGTMNTTINSANMNAMGPSSFSALLIRHLVSVTLNLPTQLSLGVTNDPSAWTPQGTSIPYYLLLGADEGDRTLDFDLGTI